MSTGFSKFLKPTANRMLVMKPRAAGRAKESKSAGGLYIPAQNEYIRSEYGLVCEVMKVGPQAQDYKKGDLVLVAQYSGLPVYEESQETDAWLITTADVLAQVDESYRRYAGE